MFELAMDLDLTHYGETDRREVDPPIPVESATWTPGGTLDWWVKERQQWLGRVRGPDGRQRWIKAADLRPAKRVDHGDHAHDFGRIRPAGNSVLASPMAASRCS
jgi:hypothetical protein